MEGENQLERCDSCNILLGVQKRNKRIYKRRAIDPITNKLLVMCNACGLRLNRAGWRDKKEPVKVEKEVCLKGFELFSKALCDVLQDNDADRLYCPVVTPKLCYCIQRHVILGIDGKDADFRLLLQGNISERINKEKAVELYELHKNAKDLIKMKVPKPVDQTLTTNELMGVVKLRTKEYEQFVLINRERLKKTYSICERGVQRILCYSNNYLHKQLKTSPNGEARIASKSTVVAKLLPDIGALSETKCCSRHCTRLALTHSRLIERWRSKALLGQRDARVVLAEMLTPAGGAVNCPTFLHLVTGCSSGLLKKVKKEMKLSAGVREPPEHGLREYWRRKKINAARNQDKSNNNKFINTDNSAGVVAYTAVINRNSVKSSDVIEKTMQARKPIIMSTNSFVENFKSEVQVSNKSNDNYEQWNNNMNTESTNKLSNTVIPDLLNGNINNNNRSQENNILSLPVTTSNCIGFSSNQNDIINHGNNNGGHFNLINSVLTSTGQNSVNEACVSTANNDDEVNDSNSQRVQFIEITKLSSSETIMPVSREETVPVESVIIITPGCLLLNDSLIVTS